MKKISIDYLLYLIIFSNIIYFSIGFIYQHDFSNGGSIDFDHIYNNILLFKQNSILNIDWSQYESTSLPLHYIIIKYIIPSDNTFIFKFYTFIISLLCIIPLYSLLKIKTNTTYFNLNLLFLSSIIFISSSFRTDAFFGLEENIGYFIFFITFFLFFYYFKNQNIYLLILLIFFSSLIFYTRQSYAFVPILVYFTVIDKNQIISIKNIVITLLFIIFLFPSIYFFYSWGSLVPNAAAERLVAFDFNKIAMIFGMFVIFTIPFFILLFLNKRRNLLIFKNKKTTVFLLIGLIIYLITFWNIPLSDFGGGPLYKIFLEYPSFKLIYLFLSYLGLVSVIFFSFKNYYLLTFFVFFIFIYSFADNLFFSYLDPLLLLVLLVFNDDIILDLKKNKNRCLCLYLYFLTLHLGWIYYFGVVIGDTLR